MLPPSVFLSYSHDTQEHKLWVQNLAIRLRHNGVDAVLDQWDLGPGGDLPHFMEQSITKADRILMICTERYVEKANLGVGGVGYEKMIVTADLISRIDANKVIPIVRQASSPRLPKFLGSKIYVDLSSSDQFETGFDQLLRELLDAPIFQKPPIGPAPTLLPSSSPIPTLVDPATQFMTALAAVYQDSSADGAVDTNAIKRKMGASKLFFDHAFDLVLEKNLVYSNSYKTAIWVNPTGRTLMLKLSENALTSA